MQEQNEETAPEPIPREDPATEAFGGEADELARDALREATGASDPPLERDDAPSVEEVGGPFVVSDAPREVSREPVDEEWTREAEPSPMRAD